MSKSIWRHASIDIETYSDVDIAKAGLYKYTASIGNGPIMEGIFTVS